MDKSRRIQDVICLIMKISLAQLLLLTIFASLVSAAEIKGQEVLERRVSLQVEDLEVGSVLEQIERQASVFFSYRNATIASSEKVTLTVTDAPLGSVLKELFGEAVRIDVRKNEILLKPKQGRTTISQGVAIEVRGIVYDEDGQSLPGVNVVEKGTTNGTTTDTEGKFHLQVGDNNSVLVFSFIGYVTQEIAVGNRTDFSVSLASDVKALEEVVVVGYGTQKKVNLTGSVESVDEKDIVSRPVGQATMALQGTMAGVTVTQNSGKPGADGGVIRIRGIGTIGNTGQDPLILVDGVPMGLNDIDVNEIESISVLKDAASGSIYGSRAANGVVLVTTKRAKKEQFTINYRGSAGWQEPTALVKKVSGYDHMVMINEANRNVGRPEPFTQDYIDAYKENAPSDEYPETNWHEEMLRKRAFQQSHYLSLNSGGEKISLLGSLSYHDQDGLMYSNYQRVNIRLNSDIRLKDNLQFKLDLLARNEVNSEPPQGWGWLARYPHNLAGKNEDGSWGIGWDGTNGWATQVDGGHADNKTDDLIANIRMDWQPIDGLNVAAQVSPNKSYNHYKNFRKHVNLYFPDGIIINPTPYRAYLTEKYTKAVTNNFKALVSYDKNLGDHTVGILGGWEAIDYKNEFIQGFRDQYPLENYEVLDVGSTANQQATGSAHEWSLLSYFGRVNYNYKERYLFEANARVDGSSRFALGYKYGFFPSFSAGWRLSEETFMSRTKTWLDELKVRASWGKLGNQNIGNYPFSSAITMGQNYVFGPDVPALGGALLEGANPRISWETTEMVNIGIDAVVGKFSVTADYYVKDTRDILLRLPVPQIAGLAAPFQNAGKVRNTGWDMKVQYDHRGNDFQYSIAANIADVRNEVLDLVGTGPYISARTVTMEGQPIGALFGLKSSGLFQSQEEIDQHASQFGPLSPGDIRYVDQPTDNDGDGIADGPDGVVNAEDRVVMGSTIPRYTYGFNFSGRYRNFDIGLFIQGVGKVDGYLDNFATMAFYLGGTAQEWHKDHWSESNRNASYPRLTFNYPNNEQVSSYWVRSAAYLRVKNVQIGYSFPRTLIERISLQKLRIFASGQNLLTFDKFYDSYDPEAPTGQGDFYPMVRVFVFGIETTF